MIEILDPRALDERVFQKNLIENIQEYSLLDNKRIGWNYCYDYSWIVMQLEKMDLQNKVIVDIGAGPGAVHGYLEDKFKIDIIGIDLNRWENDYVDFVGDYSNPTFRKECGLVDGSVDIIISSSAFEHNRPRNHYKLVQSCLQSLSENGRLITTFAVSPTNRVKRFRNSDQWNLPVDIIRDIYGEEVNNHKEYKDIWNAWHNNNRIRKGFQDRYGFFNDTSPPFLSIGANIPKSVKKNTRQRMFYL